jgi:hypothetical protein
MSPADGATPCAVKLAPFAGRGSTASVPADWSVDDAGAFGGGGPAACSAVAGGSVILVSVAGTVV